MPKKKELIAQALFNPQNNLSDEIIIWACKHLPDDNSEGIYNDNVKHFDHSLEDVTEAVGLNKKIKKEAINKLKSIIDDYIDRENSKKSELIEEIYKEPDIVLNILIAFAQSIRINEKNGKKNWVLDDLNFNPNKKYTSFKKVLYNLGDINPAFFKKFRKDE